MVKWCVCVLGGGLGGVPETLALISAFPLWSCLTSGPQFPREVGEALEAFCFGRGWRGEGETRGVASRSLSGTLCECVCVHMGVCACVHTGLHLSTEL